MIKTWQITTPTSLLHEAAFVEEMVQAIYKSKIESFDVLPGIFEALRRSVARPDAAVWVQAQGTDRLAFGAAVINYTVKGEVICWLWLIYSKPGADLPEALKHYILPWAKQQGATHLQASNTDYSPTKARWFRNYDMKKQFEVYGRAL